MTLRIDQLAVCGHGMVTAVGNDAASTCAAMRAKVRGFATANLWDKTGGLKLQAARPKLHQWWEGATMWPELAAPAVWQCLQQAAAGVTGRVLDAQAIPVLSLLPPETRPLSPRGTLAGFSTALEHRLGVTFPEGSGSLRAGRTGMAQALHWAAKVLSQPEVGAVVVVGVESFLRQAIVEHYIDERRLLCATNSNGFIPGEAACAVLIARADDGAPTRLRILGLGHEHEPLDPAEGATQATQAQALSRAWRSALEQARVPFHDIAFTLSDLNGERHKFKEAAIAAGRNDRVPPEGRSRRIKGLVELWHPSECLGEIGAAISPCLLAWALEAGRRGYAPSRHTLIHASEDDGARLAIVAAFEPGVAS
jgi:3-oxoacyl-[acyl-carrier-protein] synthase-1